MRAVVAAGLHSPEPVSVSAFQRSHHRRRQGIFLTSSGVDRWVIRGLHWPADVRRQAASCHSPKTGVTPLPMAPADGISFAPNRDVSGFAPDLARPAAAYPLQSPSGIGQRMRGLASVRNHLKRRRPGPASTPEQQHTIRLRPPSDRAAAMDALCPCLRRRAAYGPWRGRRRLLRGTTRTATARCL